MDIKKFFNKYQMIDMVYSKVTFVGNVPQPSAGKVKQQDDCYFQAIETTCGQSQLETVYQSLTDQKLLIKISQDDKMAFNEIYRRYWNSLYQMTYHRLKDQDVCMDILQETFMWLWVHRGQVAVVKSIPAFMTGGIKFKIANYIRHKKVRDKFFTSAERIQHEKLDQCDELEFKELKEFMHQFCNQLPEKCRDVFFMSRTHQFSHREIAYKLNISEKTVENQISIALKKIRLFIARINEYTG